MTRANKMTPAETLATSRLQQHCLAREAAFKVAQRTDGQWVGVVFAIGIEPGHGFRTAPTRIECVDALIDFADTQWPRTPAAMRRARLMALGVMP